MHFKLLKFNLWSQFNRKGDNIGRHYAHIQNITNFYLYQISIDCKMLVQYLNEYKSFSY